MSSDPPPSGSSTTVAPSVAVDAPPPVTTLAGADTLTSDTTPVGTKRKEFSSSSPPYGRGGISDRGGRGAKRGRSGGGRGGRSRADSFEENDPNASNVPPTPILPQTHIQQQFAVFSSYLDARNDRRESVYQSSRDLTRSSKKLIGQLQRSTAEHANPTERQAILEAGRVQLKDLHHMVAATMEGFTEDEYFRFGGAVSPGVQEFIESASLLYYLETGELITKVQIEADLEETLGRKVPIALSDYIVGILDLGGELMRFATNSVTSGNRDIVATICVFLRQVYAEYQKLAAGISHGGPYKELNKKMEVWLQSLMKIEQLQYKLHIRGAEFPDAKMLGNMLMLEANQGAQMREQQQERDQGDEGQGGDD